MPMRFNGLGKPNIFTLLVLAFLVCPLSVRAADEHKPINVVASIPPLESFVKAVGGDRVQVTVMVPQTANEHTYEPTPYQLKMLSDAALYVEVGSGLEFEMVWMDRFKQLNDRMLICDASENIELIGNPEAHDHHGGHGVRNDPHIWLSPKNAQAMVRNIQKALIQLDSEHREEYTKNSDAYAAKLEVLDEELKQLLARKAQPRYFVVSHSAWGYFARDYGLTEIAIESEGKEPSAAQILEIIKTAKQQNIKAVFVVPQFSSRSAAMVAKEIDAELKPADPLNVDYLMNLINFAKTYVQYAEASH